VDPRGPVVVVGAGTAGSVVARTLASSCDSEIIVVEPGGQTDDDNPRFLDHLVDATLWPGLPVPQARALGGGSAVNGMILSGAEPGWLAGLTRHARPGEEGGVGRQLLGLGGRHSRMWWNNGRWNPARAMLHVEEEGRLRIVRSTVERLVMRDGRATGVMTADGGIECGHVVMCAGAVLSPRVLIASGRGCRTTRPSRSPCRARTRTSAASMRASSWTCPRGRQRDWSWRTSACRGLMRRPGWSRCRC
jgi:choline dehydrogenase-like flavoprotein